MPENSNDPWAGLPEDQALHCVRQSVAPRWEAWTVALWDGGTVWCTRRVRRWGAGSRRPSCPAAGAHRLRR